MWTAVVSRKNTTSGLNYMVKQMAEVSSCIRASTEVKEQSLVGHGSDSDYCGAIPSKSSICT